MKFTNQYLASDFRSIEVIQEKFESVDDLLDEGGDMVERKQRFKGHMMTLIAAYYNLGASFEHLKKFDMALLAFQRAMTYCLQFIPDCSREMVEKIKLSIDQVQQKAVMSLTTSMIRQNRRDDLAPRSLDPQRLENLREQRGIQRKKLASEWYKQPVKVLGLRKQKKSPPANKKLETIDLLYDQHLRRTKFEYVQTSMDSFDARGFDHRSQVGYQAGTGMQEYDPHALTERTHTSQRMTRSFVGPNLKNLIDQV